MNTATVKPRMSHRFMTLASIVSTPNVINMFAGTPYTHFHVVTAIVALWLFLAAFFAWLLEV